MIFVIYLQIVLKLKKAVAVRKSGSQIKGPLADAIRFLSVTKKSHSFANDPSLSDTSFRINGVSPELAWLVLKDFLL